MAKKKADYSFSDADKTGVFKEMSYISVGDPYKGPFKGGFRKPRKGLKEFQTNPPKRKGSVDGYFDKTFPRLFAGEAVSDPAKERNKAERKNKAKFVAGPFVPTNSSKKLGGSGGAYGTFHGKHEYLSPAQRPQKKAAKQSKNFYTSPAKRGSSGMVGLTLGGEKFLNHGAYGADAAAAKKHAAQSRAKIKGGAFRATAPKNGGVFHANPYRHDGKGPKPSRKPAPAAKKITTPFYPTRRPPPMKGGLKNLGGFDKYPEYKPQKEAKKAPKRETKVFRPTARHKPLPTKSVMALSVNRTINAGNFRTVHV